MKSFWAAKVDASSIDHGTDVRWRPANDAMAHLIPDLIRTNGEFDSPGSRQIRDHMASSNPYKIPRKDPPSQSTTGKPAGK